jgi:DNA-binding LytR/AlgR family response regulator
MSRPCIFFRHSGALKKLNIDEIIFMEARNNYVKFYFHGGHFMVRSTLDAVLSRLPGNDFLRVHRSFAVSIDYIDEIAKGVIALKDFQDGIPVSRQHYPEILKQIIILDAESPKKKKSAGG